jgi:hypothetical protein
MSHLDTLFLKQLSVNSAQYRDPLMQLPWHALSLDDFWLPPAALSLTGLAEFERQPEALQRRLSQYEFVNFIQAGLWLEGIFIERLSQALHKTESLAEHAYNLHEIREEAGHSLMFLKLMEQSGLHLPRGSFQRPRFADFLGRHASIRSTLFWLAVVMGEEIPDRLTRFVRINGATINPLIQSMCRLHVIDEARHIARSRHTLQHRLASQSPLTRAMLAPLVRGLLAQFVRAFYLPGSAVYELAGLSPGHHWRELARRNPARQDFIAHCINPTLHLLAQYGFKVDTPRL